MAKQIADCRLQIADCSLRRRRPAYFVAAHLLLSALVCLLLSGCMLMAGRDVASEGEAGRGLLRTSFVSAEGEQRRALDVGGPGTVRLQLDVRVAQGELRLEVFDPEGRVALAVNGRSGGAVAGASSIRTDERGRVSYRVLARNARDGAYQLSYQR
jgi:hypothetical protein